MSEQGPGTRNWWIETVAVCVGGVLLAAWLWDGWPFETRLVASPAAPAERQPRTLSEALDAGCLTADNLAALRDGRPLRIQCPESRP